MRFLLFKLRYKFNWLIMLPLLTVYYFKRFLILITGNRSKLITQDIACFTLSSKTQQRLAICPTSVGLLINRVFTEYGEALYNESILNTLRERMVNEKHIFDELIDVFNSRDAGVIITLMYEYGEINETIYKSLMNKDFPIYEEINYSCRRCKFPTLKLDSLWESV